jgi:hypothetical protein
LLYFEAARYPYWEENVDYEFWKDAWVVMTNAPVIIIGIAICAMGLAWYWRGYAERSEKSGLRARMEAIEERIKLARENEESVRQKLAIAESRAANLESEIAAATAPGTVSVTAASVVSSIKDASTANAALQSTISTFSFKPPRQSYTAVFRTAFMRTFLWGLVALLAAVPPVLSLSAPLQSLAGTIGALNATGHVRDLFYLLLPTSALALSGVLDYLRLGGERSSAVVLMLAMLAIMMNFLALLSALLAFLSLPSEKYPLPEQTLSLYLSLLGLGLLISFITDIGVSIASDNLRNKLY